MYTGGERVIFRLKRCAVRCVVKDREATKMDWTSRCMLQVRVVPQPSALGVNQARNQPSSGSKVVPNEHQPKRRQILNADNLCMS